MEKYINFIKQKKVPSVVIIMFIFLAMSFYLVSGYHDNTVNNPDIYFLLNHGEYVLENGFPFIEPFSIHQGLKFVMQQWLTSVIFYVIYSKLGFIGLLMFSVLVSFLIIYMFYRVCRVVSDNKYLSLVLTLIFSAFIVNFSIVSRPQIISYLVFLFLFFCLESFIKTRNKRYLYILPLLSIVMINCHAALWGLLFCFMIPYIINGFKFEFKGIKSGGYGVIPLIISFVIMFLCGFLNPYGIDSMSYILNSYGINESSL